MDDQISIDCDRLIESWMDLIPDLDIQSPEVIAAIMQRRTAHEEQQQNLVGIAAAIPLCSTTCCRALDRRDVKTNPCANKQCKKTATENMVPFE